MNIGVIIGIILLFVVSYLIFTQVRENLTPDDPAIVNLKNKLGILFSGSVKFTGILEKLNGKKYMSMISIQRGNKSYTINKKRIYMCLKDQDGNYYNTNTLVNVCLHEISHTICPDTDDHSPTFYKIFDELLLKAEECGIYDPKLPMDPDYCKFGDSSA